MVLFSRFQAIWGRKWDLNLEKSSLEIAMQEWQFGIEGLSDISVKSALDYCRMNLEWPPSIAEFIRLAERHTGMPTPRDALNLAIQRDSSPLAIMIVQQIGSWDLSHESEKSLLPRVKEIMREFRATQVQGIENGKYRITDHTRR
jgi:hypothetical protein